MGRYLNLPQQQIIPQYSSPNIEFYANILAKAQNDLERGTATKAAYLDKLNEYIFFDENDRSSTLGKAQDRLKGALDDDFVSPAKIANEVMRVNQEITPGLQALKAKAQAAEYYDKLKMTHGANAWLSADPRTKSITGENGRFVDPNQFKVTGINAEDVDKNFYQSQLQELTASFDQKVKSDLPGYHKINKYTGLADDKREALYKPGSPQAISIARAQLQSMPQLKEIFSSEQEALNQLMVRNYQTAGNYKQSVDSQYLQDRDYIDADTRARGDKTPDAPRLFTPIDGDVTKANVMNDALNSHIKEPGVNFRADEIQFDDNGKIVPIKTTDVRTTYTDTYAVTAEELTPKERIERYSKNIAQNKLITNLRKDLSAQGLMTIKDSKTGKTRSRTDKEVYDLYTTAINNSANVFGVNYQIQPGLDIVGANPFFAPDGSRKDFRNANIEVDLNDGNGWRMLDETKFAEELGYDLSSKEDKKNYYLALKDMGHDVYDFMGGKAKIRTAMTGKDGNEISVRYDAPKDVKNAKQGVVRLYEAFTKPVRDMKIPVAYDTKSNKPVSLIVNSNFQQDREGNIFIYPEVTIPNDTELGIYLNKVYQSAGYSGLIEEMQSMTDQSLVNNNNVFVRKVSNVKEIE